MNPIFSQRVISPKVTLSNLKMLNENDIIMYTDGSCPQNSNVATRNVPAGFGVVILNNCPEGYLGDAEIIDRLYGPVCIDKNQQWYLGADYASNNTAELTAIGEALLYARDFCQDAENIVIIYDSEYAGKTIQGKFNGKKN